jgi:hypothetical protein
MWYSFRFVQPDDRAQGRGAILLAIPAHAHTPNCPPISAQNQTCPTSPQ